MLEEFKKSIQSVLYERISSPFSGAFVLSWLVWNWKLIYYIITVESKIPFDTRVQFIQSNYIIWEVTLLYPVLSAAFFVIFYPFITTGAMYIWLKHKKWQNEIRDEIEKKQLLTFEQSTELRFQIRSQAEKFEKMLQEKDEEIKLLKEKEKLDPEKNSVISVPEISNSENTSYDIAEFSEIYKSPYVQNHFGELHSFVMRKRDLIGNVPNETISLLDSYGIIVESDSFPRQYVFTSKGKRFIKWYFEKINS